MAPLATARSLTIRRPDDWHLHLRDGAMLAEIRAKAIIGRPVRFIRKKQRHSTCRMPRGFIIALAVRPKEMPLGSSKKPKTLGSWRRLKSSPPKRE